MSDETVVVNIRMCDIHSVVLLRPCDKYRLGVRFDNHNGMMIPKLVCILT